MYRYRRQASQKSAERRCSLVSMKLEPAPIAVALVITVALEPRSEGDARCNWLWWWLGLVHPRCGSLDTRQHVDRCGAFGQRLAQPAVVTITGLNDVLEVADRLAGQLSADGAAQERALMEHADLAEVTRVVAGDDVLADVGRHGQVEIAETLKMSAVALHPPRTSDV